MTLLEQPSNDGATDPNLLHDFIDFYKTTFQKTFGTAYRAAGGDTQLAYDATQEAYVAMLQLCRDNKKPEGDVCRYTVGIAVHKVIDFYRARDRYVLLEEKHDCGSHETRYAEVLDTMTVFQKVRDFLDRQPPRRRAVGALYFLEEFDYVEIAEALGMSRSTARTHVHRLRSGLQQLINRITLEDRGGERP
jgi:RNA polymerase sigma factor (sigma-70 family)